MIKPLEPSRFKTAAEVAELLGISRKSVYRRIKKGQLAAFRIGRILRIDPKDLEQFRMKIEEGKV